jgi:hypothetical protein
MVLGVVTLLSEKVFYGSQSTPFRSPKNLSSRECPPFFALAHARNFFPGKEDSAAPFML